jgi:hypothetical protein
MTYCISLFILIVFISACGSGTNDPGEQVQVLPSPGFAPQEKGVLLSEAREGDFILRIETEKSEYTDSEPVKIVARLKYDGDLPEVMIGHAMSPISFPIIETTRDIEVDYVMPQPLIRTVLKKGEWFEETYTKAGGYGDQDPDKDFLKRFLTGESFPEGNYLLSAQASFILYDGEPDQDGTKETDFAFHTEQIQIDVE